VTLSLSPRDARAERGALYVFKSSSTNIPKYIPENTTEFKSMIDTINESRR